MDHLDAMHDTLTGAMNFQHMQYELPREYARCRRYKHPLAILRCDIDRLKLINHGFGREAGDEVLREFYARAQTMLRSSDWVARPQDDEFIVVLPETDLSGAAIVAERLRKSIAARPFDSMDGPFNATVSIGYTAVIAAAELHRYDPADLLETAAEQLQVAIKRGRNTISGCLAKRSSDPETSRVAAPLASGVSKARAASKAPTARPPVELKLVEEDALPPLKRR